MSNTRIVGRVEQGVDERIAYQIDSVLNGTPTSPTVVAKLRSATGTYTDVTTTVFPTNSPTIATTIITLSLFRDHTLDAFYRIEVKYTVSGNILEDVIEVIGTL